MKVGAKAMKRRMSAPFVKPGKGSQSLGVEAVRPQAMAFLPPQQDAVEEVTQLGEQFAVQLEEVKAIMQQDQLCPLHKVVEEVEYFYNQLGLDPTYFGSQPAETVAKHVLCLYSAKAYAQLTGAKFSVDVKQEEETSALYIGSTPALDVAHSSTVFEIEQQIETRYLHEVLGSESGEDKIQAFANSDANKRGKSIFKIPKRKSVASGQQRSGASLGSSSGNLPAAARQFRVFAYRSSNHVSHEVNDFLWFFFVQEARFLESGAQGTNINKIGNVGFMQELGSDMRPVVQGLVNEASKGLTPSSRIVVHSAERKTFKFMMCYRSQTAYGMYSNLSNLLKDHNLVIVRKHLEPLQGYNLVTVVFKVARETKGWQQKLLSDVSLLYTLPTCSFSYLFQSNVVSLSEVTYLHCASLFIYYFCARNSERDEVNIKYLEDRLPDSTAKSKLALMTRAHQLNTWHESRIRETLLKNLDLMRQLFAHFNAMHAPADANADAQAHFAKCDSLADDIRAKSKKLDDVFETQVILGCLEFNTNTIKTNFFRRNKACLVFDIKPVSLTDEPRRYPVTPFCVLMLVGVGFRGFHVRFSDIARGGVRLIRSNTPADWQRNQAELLFENYSLALTQQKKNKDIPEGGSKGVILTQPGAKNLKEPFARYIDAVLDLLLPDAESASHYSRLDPKAANGNQDLIFLGPDENTADLMDWASEHAHKRGLSIWKAFTTGKGPDRGGIPHDKYGMTTRSVREYVEGAMRELGMKPEEVVKCQTGGPDGDLGSNEILLSNEKTIAIVDGSGVAYDQNGLNRDELVRLAKLRKPIQHFDTKLLSSKGFLVLVDDENRTLFDGTVVESGVQFRNTFHLHPLFHGDLFVPCGGRPEAVNMGNIDAFATVKGANGEQPRFKLIVEGANLFITQHARLELEQTGIVLFKDACANKGGVTSSSQEVLAALCMRDAEFSENMCAEDLDNPPDFYKRYAEEVQKKIHYNAKREFECLWREHKDVDTPISELVDTLSQKINELSFSVRGSELLWSDVNLRAKIFKMAIPPLLLEFVGGVDKLLERVPDAYCRWIFSAFLASHYVYTHGLRTTEFTFMTFIDELRSAK